VCCAVQTSLFYNCIELGFANKNTDLNLQYKVSEFLVSWQAVSWDLLSPALQSSRQITSVFILLVMVKKIHIPIAVFPPAELHLP
jgi:hypothetical protein